MQTPLFSGLYKVQYNPVGNTNHDLYMASAGNYAVQVAKEWSEQNDGKTAKAFMVEYPYETEKMPKELKDAGFINIISPEPGKHYDMFIATDEGPEGENTATQLAQAKADDAKKPLNLVRDFLSKKLLSKRAALPDSGIKLLLGKDRENAVNTQFVKNRKDQVKPLEVDYEYHYWEESLPLSEEDKAKNITGRYRQHHDDSVKEWRIPE